MTRLYHKNLKERLRSGIEPQKSVKNTQTRLTQNYVQNYGRREVNGGAEAKITAHFHKNCLSS